MLEEEIHDIGHVTARFRESRAGGPISSWIFRGQAYDVKIPLATSLERACLLTEGSLQCARDREAWTLREFQRRLHQYVPSCPALAHTLEWLALMQHHGAPTRLLDWTHSPYIAALFACEHALRTTGPAAIWVMNATWATAASADKFRDGLGESYAQYIMTLTEPSPPDEDDRFEHVFMRRDAPAPACLCPINAFRLNERQTIQKGLFTVVGDPTQPCVDNLKALDGYGDTNNVRLWLIPREHIGPMIEDLAAMNITSATLFPGLDGFARSLNFLSWFAPNQPM